MMFDSYFAKCETVEECNEVYDVLRGRTALESRVFLKRALNKALEGVPTEQELLALREEAQRREAVRSAYREEQRRARDKVNHMYGRNGDTLRSYTNELHNRVAHAVADDTNVSLPRRWLSNHSLAIADISNLEVPNTAKQIVSDFKLMVREAKDALKLKRESIKRSGTEGPEVFYTLHR